MNAMRVLLISAEYPPITGGIGDYTVELAQALSAQDVAIAVLTGDEQSEQVGDVPVLRRVRSWGRKLRIDVDAVLAEWQPDVVHIQYQTGAYQMKPAINLLPSRLDVPTVVTFHDLRMPYLAPKVAPLRRYITRVLLENAAAVVVTNAEDQARLVGDSSLVDDPDLYTLSQTLIPPPVLIPIGANIAVHPLPNRAALREQLGVPTNGMLVAYFGLLNRSKGVHTIVEALQYLPASTYLIIIGGSAISPQDQEYAQEVQATLKRLNLHKRVIWTGYLRVEDVSHTLQAADVAALPFVDGASYRRGSLLATLAHGLPTITTPPRVLLDPPLRNLHNVLLVEPNDAISLALAIEQIGDEPKLCTRLTAAARNIAYGFHWDSIATQHRKLYAQVIAQHAANQYLERER